MISKLTGCKSNIEIDCFYIINPDNMDDETFEYWLCNEIIENYGHGNDFIRLRDIYSVFPRTRKSRVWRNIIHNSTKYPKPLPGYLSAFRFKDEKWWYVTLK